MRLSNVPAITRRYWAAILVASMCGANTGDFRSHNLHLGHTRGLLPLAILFLLILWADGSLLLARHHRPSHRGHQSRRFVHP
jgi:uncharacterized membrane-anchored protein